MITSAAAVLALAASAAPPTAATPDFPTCGAVVDQPCRIPDAISAAEARRWLGDRESVWRIDGDTLKVVAAGAQPPRLCCTFQGTLDPVPGASSLWELSLRAPQLDEAVVDVVLLGPTGAGKLEVWRGPEAPPAAAQQAPPAEWLHSVTLDSKALGEQRRLEIYAPPADGKPRPVIYMADGENVPALAAIAHGLAMAGAHPGADPRRARCGTVRPRAWAAGL
jgi:hypothetical protein